MSFINLFFALSLFVLPGIKKHSYNQIGEPTSKYERDTCVLDISINNLSIDDSASISKVWGNIRDKKKYKWTFSDDEEGIDIRVWGSISLRELVVVAG